MKVCIECVGTRNAAATNEMKAAIDLYTRSNECIKLRLNESIEYLIGNFALSSIEITWKLKWKWLRASIDYTIWHCFRQMSTYYTIYTITY